MANRNYLVTYDISDPKRLKSIFKLLKGYGEPWQKSVFFCHLGLLKRKKLEIRLLDLIHNWQDQVLIIDLGADQKKVRKQISVFGRALRPSLPRIIVI